MKHRHFSHRLSLFAGLLSLLCAVTAAWALSGKIIEFPVPTANSGPFGITAGPDGNLWFTELNANSIGRITTAGVITEFPVTTDGAPAFIAAGADFNLWFIESNSKIGRFSPTPSHKLSEFPVPTANSQPLGI